MKRTLLISDIHGEYDSFIQLLEKVKYNPKEDQLVLLGDYIDRGPDSKRVIEKIMDLRKEGAITLMGNHDRMMIDATDGKEKGWDRWERNGGLATLANYHSGEDVAKIPETEEYHRHVEFLRSLDYYHETEDYIFVHAGVEPGKHPKDTKEWTLIWIREDFFRHYKGDKTVVFGHTPAKYLNKDRSNHIYFGENNVIGIDGGAVYGGQLNCLELPSRKTYSIKSKESDEKAK